MAFLYLKNKLFPWTAVQIPKRKFSSEITLESPPSDLTERKPASSPASPCRQSEQERGVDLEAQKTSPNVKDSPTMSDSKASNRFKVSPDMIRDATVGLSDGLTVPFALSAGLSALGSTKLVVTGGLAELISGGISMGLGGFLGAKSEAEWYQAKLRETRRLIQESPTQTSAMVRDVFVPYGLPDTTIFALSNDLHNSPERLLEFLMSFHHQLAAPPKNRAYVSALTLALGYFGGGFIPLIPYFCVSKTEVLVALWWSIGVMVVTLFVFGYVKTCISCGWRGRANVVGGLWGGVQMCIIGGLAAGAAVGLVRAINRGGAGGVS